MIEKDKLDTLFKSIHQSIDEAAGKLILEIKKPDICYPPNVELTREEQKALNDLVLSKAAKSGLKKLVSNACSTPLFHMFCIFDGVGDLGEDYEPWLGLYLTERTLDGEEPEGEFLHDQFFETSWLYKDWTKE